MRCRSERISWPPARCRTRSSDALRGATLNRSGHRTASERSAIAPPALPRQTEWAPSATSTVTSSLAFGVRLRDLRMDVERSNPSVFDVAARARRWRRSDRLHRMQVLTPTRHAPKLLGVPGVLHRVVLRHPRPHELLRRLLVRRRRRIARTAGDRRRWRRVRGPGSRRRVAVARRQETQEQGESRPSDLPHYEDLPRPDRARRGDPRAEIRTGSPTVSNLWRRAQEAPETLAG